MRFSEGRLAECHWGIFYDVSLWGPEPCLLLLPAERARWKRKREEWVDGHKLIISLPFLWAHKKQGPFQSSIYFGHMWDVCSEQLIPTSLYSWRFDDGLQSWNTPPSPTTLILCLIFRPIMCWIETFIKFIYSYSPPNLRHTSPSYTDD